MKIVVLAGGLSPERNVSLSTGTMVTEALRQLGHRAVLIDLFFGLEGWQGAPEDCFDMPSLTGEDARRVSAQAPDLEKIRAQRQDQSGSQFGPGVLELCRMADAVFLALHGACGEDGRVQAALDLLGVAYTGSGYLGSAIAMDKDLTKRLVSGLVDTPAWTMVEYGADVDALTERAELPLVVKPVAGGSSIGVSIARSREQLREALKQGLCPGGRVVLEQYVQGREIQVGILDGQALPSIEIIPRSGFYDYENKYQPGAAEERCPAALSAQTEAALGRAALAVYRALGLSVYARADFILDEQGRAWFLEVNTLPGMTPTSLLPQEAAAAGIAYPQLCQRILDASLRVRQQER